jgi:adenosine deaminase
VTVPASDAEIAGCPKVELHDHLDGGLRPVTILELADACGYTGLPADDSEELARWFVDAASSGSLPRYLKTFAHTVAVTRSAEALVRVAREAVVDLAADGVVYAEIRMAPELVLTDALSWDGALEAMVEGLRAGERAAAEAGQAIATGLLVCGLKHTAHVPDAVDAAIRWRDRGVVGFDLAGPEAGFPFALHADSLARLRTAGVPLTLHAGEGAGPESVWEALAHGARRVGHGVRAVEDPRLVELLAERGTCLEVAPTSNLQTGIAARYDAHPFGQLDAAGVRVTVNTDNRLMSGTSVSAELRHLRDAFGVTAADLERYARNAAAAAFRPDAPTLAPLR